MFYGLPHRDATTYICKQRRRRQRYPQNEQHTQSALLPTRELCLDIPTTDLSHDVSRSVAVTSHQVHVHGNWLNVPHGAVL